MHTVSSFPGQGTSGTIIKRSQQVDHEQMMRAGIAVLVAAAILFAVGWFDGTLIQDAQRHEATTFDIIPLIWWLSLGSLVTAAGVLVVALAGWWARSLVAGILFVIGGAFFALLLAINYQLAASMNGAPPTLPEPLARVVNQIYFWQNGPIGSMRIVGAATFMVGLLVIGADIRRRFRERAAAGVTPEIQFDPDRARP